MLTTAYVNISSFFYPIGNTTAICLTQDLSPEQPAEILLLGCGDARNVLFTSYSEDPESWFIIIACTLKYADLQWQATERLTSRAVIFKVLLLVLDSPSFYIPS